MPYIYHSDSEIKQMLESIGLKSEEALFDNIPQEYLLKNVQNNSQKSYVRILNYRIIIICEKFLDG